MAKFNNEYEYLFHLLACVLKDRQPEEKPDNLDFGRLFAIAKHHSVANIAFYAVEKLSSGPEPELRNKWSVLRDKAVFREVTQQHEFDVFCNIIREEKMRCLPVKGIFLKDLYPQRDMRMMSDIDVLFDKENVDKLRKILPAKGYEADEMDEEDHDAYLKKPVISIEVHRCLFGHGGEKFAEMFADPWQYATEISPYIWCLDKNWFFIYIFAHLEKHYQFAGTGIRSIMDIWVYTNAYKDELDWDFIYSQFDKVGSSDFLRDILELCEIWFEGKPATKKSDKMTAYILNSGTFGNYSTMIANKQEKKGKLGYALYRIFPPLVEMKPLYPILRKAPVLLPFMWIARLFSRLVFRRKKIASEFKELKHD